MTRLHTIRGVRGHVAAARGRGERVGLVPTMGALHAGHLALVRLATEHADTVVVSVFVNPTQFDRADDLDAYPRDLAGDERVLASLGTGTPVAVFAPDVAEMYPREPLTTVHVARLTDGLCGAARPGHFDGVATVVTKLLTIVAPDVAVFGRKDAQQLRVVRRLVADLDLPVDIVDAGIVREPDGLALSSRNRRLGTAERTAALALPHALRAAVDVAQRTRSAGAAVRAGDLRSAALAVIADAPGVDLEYLEVVDPVDLEPADGAVELEPGSAGGRLLVAVAATVGAVRLIDNVEIGDVDDERSLTAVTRPPVRET